MTKTNNIVIFSQTDATILRAARNIIREAQGRARDLALTGGQDSAYVGYQLGKLSGYTAAANDALGTLLIWADILNPPETAAVVVVGGDDESGEGGAR